MCTLSWTALGGVSATVFFNRDERRSRAVGQPPSPGKTGDVRWLAPRDPDGGGTWLLASERGLVLALLNWYESKAVPEPAYPRTRGELPVLLAEAEDPADALEGLRSLDLAPYRPFHLAALMPGHAVRLASWNGCELTARESLPLPVTTSSFDTESVLAARRETFHRMGATEPDPPAALLAKIHRQHDPARGAHSVLMHRPDARTQSLSRIDLGPAEISFAYTPVDADTGTPEKTVTASLPRRL